MIDDYKLLKGKKTYLITLIHVKNHLMKLNSHYYIFKKNKIFKNPPVRKLRIGVNFLNMMKNV